jgi:hypothetical protein
VTQIAWRLDCALTAHVRIAALLMMIVVVRRHVLWRLVGVWLRRVVQCPKIVQGIKFVRMMNVSIVAWKPPIARVAKRALRVFAPNPRHVYEVWIVAVSVSV